MDKNELRRSGLLDQYVLGLLGPEQSAEVERLIEKDPELSQQVKELRGELVDYADRRNIGPPPSGRAPRTAQDFQDLDHEMITAMMERNHSLNVWRYVLVGFSLLLIGLAGYLFRLKENYRSELVTERSLRAQVTEDYRSELEGSRVGTPLQRWKGAFAVTENLALGTLAVHVAPNSRTVLLDLLGMSPPAGDSVLVVYAESLDNPPLARFTAADWPDRLTVLATDSKVHELHIFLWPAERTRHPEAPDEPLAVINLR